MDDEARPPAQILLRDDQHVDAGLKSNQVKLVDAVELRPLNIHDLRDRLSQVRRRDQVIGPSGDQRLLQQFDGHLGAGRAQHDGGLKQPLARLANDDETIHVPGGVLVHGQLGARRVVVERVVGRHRIGGGREVQKETRS